MTDATIGDTTPHPFLFVRGRWDLTVPGAAAYRGVRFELGGSERKLLCRLVRARGTALPNAELKAALGNDALADSTLRGYVSRLNRLLRKHLPGAPERPVRGIDRMGYLLTLSG